MEKESKQGLAIQSSLMDLRVHFQQERRSRGVRTPAAADSSAAGQTERVRGAVAPARSTGLRRRGRGPEKGFVAAPRGEPLEDVGSSAEPPAAVPCPPLLHSARLFMPHE